MHSSRLFRQSERSAGNPLMGRPFDETTLYRIAYEQTHD